MSDWRASGGSDGRHQRDRPRDREAFFRHRTERIMNWRIGQVTITKIVELEVTGGSRFLRRPAARGRRESQSDRFRRPPAWLPRVLQISNLAS